MGMWDPGVGSRLSGMGFLVRMGIAQHAVCPRCDGPHYFRRLGGEPPRMATVCPEAGVVTVLETYLQEWTIDFAALARWCGAQLGALHDPVEVIPGEAWRWDRLSIAASRRMLLVARSASELGVASVWQRLGLTPRAVVLGLDATPLAADAVASIAHAAPLWSYVDDDAGLCLSADDLAEDVAATEHAQQTIRPSPCIAGGTRLRVLRLLTRELDDHIRSAQASLRQGAALPPRPGVRWLARAVGGSLGTVHRCLSDDASAAGRALRLRWAVAGDAEAIRSFRPPPSPT